MMLIFAGSGALVCGHVSGSSSEKANVSVNGLILSGLSVNLFSSVKNSSSPVALLIRSVDNYTSILISGVSTSGYSDETSTSTDDVAQSLLGVCGGEQMTINYSDMRLDSRLTNNAVNDDSVKSALFTAYETADSIFSHATLIKTLQYDSTKGSLAVYNYNYAEDWEKMAIRYITSHMARKYPIRWS